MELELKSTSLNICEASGELTLTQEETAETIVPDYCPDIARIIHTDSAVYIHNRDLREGKAELSGAVRVNVLYTPEGEGGIRNLEFAVPFTVESDSRSLPNCQNILAETRIEFLESRMLNPRKIFTHCKLVTYITGFKKALLTFSNDVDAAEEICIEKRLEQQHIILLTQVSDKDFTFTDEMNLSPGRPGAMELLTHHISHTLTEKKLIGNKLIFKGIVTLTLLYRTEEGAYSSATGELPFSQIMEVEDAPEDSIVSIYIQLTGTDIQIDNDDPDGRQIAVTLYLRALALLRQEQELELLSDFYSTAYDVFYDTAPLAITSFYEQQARRQTVREVIETGVAADSILLLSVDCGIVSASREGNITVLRTKALIRVLYQDEGGTALIAERSVDVSCQTDIPDGCQISAHAECLEEIQGSIGERGIEVRFSIDFWFEAFNQTKRICISSAKLDIEAPKDNNDAPSLVLRCIGKEESAWSIAKAYNTTVSDILAANQISEEGEIPRDKLILIPRKRI